jgi:DMSO/TMAO reductase YedYZ molybdopterin-dependent catalytic subunit
MAVTRGFTGRRRTTETPLPPGQYLTPDFPVLSAGPTPRVDTSTWRLSVNSSPAIASAQPAESRAWSWDEFLALPQEAFTVDIHCVTKWSKLGTRWEGVALDTLLAGIDSSAQYALVTSYGGYTTNLPLGDLTGGKAWIVHGYGGAPLAPEHGGPARLLVPHLYFWKSAKWVRSIHLRWADSPGFWESLGYHNYGDPWLEQRYQGD